MSEIKVDKISPQSGTALQIGDASDVITIPASATITNLGTATGFGGGKVLQVVQNHLITGSSQSQTAATKLNITGLNASITPASTGSKILIKIRWQGETTVTEEEGVFGIKRNTTDIGSGAAGGGSQPRGIAGQALAYFSSDYGSTMASAIYEYIDAPSSISSITYHATYENKTSGTLYNQRTKDDSNATNCERLTSTITLMELSAATLLEDGS
jgi:hypothetical protein